MVMVDSSNRGKVIQMTFPPERENLGNKLFSIYMENRGLDHTTLNDKQIIHLRQFYTAGALGVMEVLMQTLSSDAIAQNREFISNLWDDLNSLYEQR